MIDSVVLIFVFAAIVASLGMFVRQPLIVIYILIGMVLGPYAFNLIGDIEELTEVSEIGIIFLLFIVGLELPPNKLQSVLSRTLVVTLLSSLLFFVIGFVLAFLFGFTWLESSIIGIGVMFSSTVLGIKLLPRSVLHHRSTGEVVIGILLVQDVIAVSSLVVLYIFTGIDSSGGISLPWLVAAIPLLLILSYVGPKFIIWPLLQKFDVYTEYTFLLYIGWCLLLAFLAHLCGLGMELGAFIAGVALANSPVSQSLAETLTPLRDFFLVLFFFTVGARVQLELIPDVILLAVIIAAVLLFLKPIVFRHLLKLRRIRKPIGWEVGFRLGQCSEFTLLVLFVAAPLMSSEADHVLLIATILTLVVSTYIVIFNYRGPFAVKESMRFD